MRAAPTPLALIRHGPTRWNAEKRIQGRTDTPLGAAGRATVRTWRLPPEFAAYHWYASDKRRAIETAQLLGLDPIIEPILAEMSWGEWEGKRLPELRDALGQDFVDNESRGLDFRPPGGESPRDVQDRVLPWLARVAAERAPAGAVAHGGVIRAIYALASGWDMTGKPPVRLRDGCLQLFRLDARGNPSVDRLNIHLDGKGAAP